MHSYAKRGAAPPNTQLNSGLTMARCSKPEHQPPLHHPHHLPWVTRPWQKSESHPTHQPRRWGCFTTQGKLTTFRNYEASREGRSGAATKVQSCVTPGSPSSGQAVLKCCSTLAEGAKYTCKTHTYTPKDVFHQHSPLPDSVSGREAGTYNRLFPQESWWLSDLSKSTTGAPAAATLSLTEGNGVPTDTQVCPKGLTSPPLCRVGEHGRAWEDVLVKNK